MSKITLQKAIQNIAKDIVDEQYHTRSLIEEIVTGYLKSAGISENIKDLCETKEGRPWDDAEELCEKCANYSQTRKSFDHPAEAECSKRSYVRDTCGVCGQDIPAYCPDFDGIKEEPDDE